MHPREVGIYIQESRDVLQSHSLDEITQRGKKVSKTMWREGKGPEDAKRWGDQEIRRSARRGVSTGKCCRRAEGLRDDRDLYRSSVCTATDQKA